MEIPQRTNRSRNTQQERTVSVFKRLNELTAIMNDFENAAASNPNRKQLRHDLRQVYDARATEVSRLRDAGQSPAEIQRELNRDRNR
jgi:hypothetical protein